MERESGMAARKKKRKKLPGAGFWLFLICLVLAVSIATRWIGLRERITEEGMDFQVEVLNGTGRTGLAMKVAIELRKAGVDVLLVGDAEHYRFGESILVDRKGDPDLMKKLSKLTGCRRIVLQAQREPLVDVTFVLGPDMIDFEIVD
jgi:hypothetical protein